MTVNVSAISQLWLEKLTDYEVIDNGQVFFNYHKDRIDSYKRLAIELDKQLVLQGVNDGQLYGEYNLETLLLSITESIAGTLNKLSLEFPETIIYLYPDREELFRVTTYADSFYVVSGNEIHLVGEDLYKVVECILAYNLPTMERKLVEALAKYYFPDFNSVHQKAQYWLNFQELPPYRSFGVKPRTSLTEKDWDAYVSFVGYLVEKLLGEGLDLVGIVNVNDIAERLDTSINDLENEWVNYLRDTFYLKLARNEEVMRGEEVIGAVLLENQGESIRDVNLEVYTTVKNYQGLHLVTQRSYFYLAYGDRNMIRFKCGIPLIFDELEVDGEIQLLEAFQDEMWIIASLTYTDSDGLVHKSYMSLPVKIID